MKVSYLAGGELRYANCFTMKCKKIKKGERRLGYYYIDYPTFYGILYDIIVPDSVQAPKEGWE